MNTIKARVAVGLLATVAMAAFAVTVVLPAGAEDGGAITLSSGQTKVVTSDRVLVGSVLLPSGPDACRGEAPDEELSCDVYRLEVDLDESPEAVNFLRLQVDFDTIRTPPLSAVAAGLVPINASDLDLIIYDVTGEEPEEVTASGAGEPYKVPEIAAFEARARAYDVIVFAGRAPVLGYTFTASFSNEIFDSPFEALDPALTDNSFNSPPPEDNSAGSFEDVSAPTAAPAPSLPAFSGPIDAVTVIPAPATIGGDADFQGFRPSVDDQLAGELASFNPVTAVPVELGDPPAIVELLLWLLALPLLVTGLVVLWVRRRQSPVFGR